MDKICITLAFNGRWTADYKYLDHETKLLLVTEGITFEALMEKIHQVVNFDGDKLWFDINLGTTKGRLVTNDEELTVCLDLLKSGSHFKSRFIVDTLVNTEQVNLLMIQQEEGQAIMEIDSQHLELAPTFNETKRSKRKRPKKTGKELAPPILRDNASSNEIRVGSIFEDKQSMIRCFSNIAIREYFGFKVIRSSTKRYSSRCRDEKCGWYVSACRIKDSPFFKIVKFDNNHECSVDIKRSDQNNAISKIAGGYFNDILQETGFEVTPAFVGMEMKRRYGLDIGYHRAWRAIQQYKKMRTGESGELQENYGMLENGLTSVETLEQ